MKLSLFITFILTTSFNINAQNKTNNSEDINRWSKAVINIEVKGYNNNYPIKQKLDSIGNLIKIGLIPKERYPDYASYFMNEQSIFNTGSAIFFKYLNHYFLITARHVLYDKESFGVAKSFNGINYEDGQYNTFGQIYYVPRPNEDTVQAVEVSQWLVHPYNKSNYVFSDSATDLAIVYLKDSIGNERNPFTFLNTLLLRGYVPITIKDIDTLANLNYGDDIICLGYPFIAMEKIRPQSISDHVYKSNFIYNLAATYGRVAIPDYKGIQFIGDISILPGNSGGAFIRNRKLIGIVSSQPQGPITDSSGNILPYYFRYTYGIGIKANQIMPLLRELMRKDNLE